MMKITFLLRFILYIYTVEQRTILRHGNNISQHFTLTVNFNMLGHFVFNSFNLKLLCRSAIVVL